MSAVTLVLIALGLAMDAFAVSIASGIAISRGRLRNALKFGIFFGSFQMIMPVLGWAAGIKLKYLIAGIDHWIAFGLLAFVGCKMIYESFRLEEEEEAASHDIFVMLFLSVATSIDALAVGLTFAFLNIAILVPVIVIGAVTFIMSFFGVLIGNKIGHFFEKKFEIIGGLILIAIGIKILMEHLF